MATMTLLRPWSPPGPVAAAAFRAWGPVNLLKGPPGSGKTGTYIMKALAGTWMQNPYPDGVRRARLLVVATDYRRLWANLIPSWLEWLPKHDPENGVEWVGATGAPAVQTITMVRDGQTAILEVLFMALGDDHSDAAMEAFVAGLQVTWVWFNELQNMPYIAWSKIGPRVGRFPRAADARVVAPGIWGDLNAGIVDTWQHHLWTGGQFRDGIHLFDQPSAYSPNAENLANLDPDYYRRQELTMSEAEKERKLGNRWGRRMDGEPVIQFDDAVYVGKGELAPDYGRALLIGADAGLDPTAVLGQRRADGQCRRLAELVCEHGVGPERYGRRLGQLLDTPRFMPFRRMTNGIIAAADPSAAHGHDKQVDLSWIQRVEKEAGIRIREAPTNLLQPRLQAVRDTFTMIENVPMGLLDPVHCPNLRRAYNGLYRFRKLKVVGEDRYDPEPEKNGASHIADADQYLCLLEGGYERAKGREPSDANAVMDMARAQGLIGHNRGPRLDDRIERRPRGPARPMMIPR